MPLFGLYDIFETISGLNLTKFDQIRPHSSTFDSLNLTKIIEFEFDIQSQHRFRNSNLMFLFKFLT